MQLNKSDVTITMLDHNLDKNVDMHCSKIQMGRLLHVRAECTPEKITPMNSVCFRPVFDTVVKKYHDVPTRNRTSITEVI
jgi:hypothetical protein